MDAQTSRLDLYPDLPPFASGMLPLDGGHVMYWEQCGNPQGLPVVFLHGGPGAGAAPAHRRFFDPNHYRVVLFDQRGAGRSRPHAEIRENTTAHLVADIETLRRHLGIERWLVFGGSWGSTLALAYGIEHAERCLGFILRGIFLGRRRELDWFLNGMGTVFPEAGRAFGDFLPEDERGDLLASYHRRLTDPDPAVHMPAAWAWSRYENACSKLLPRVAETTRDTPGGERAALSLARIEAHYMKHALFLPEGHILENVERLGDVPAVLVHGRYDMVCPIVTADALARAWPQARYVIVPDAGHSVMEPGIRSALMGATEAFKTSRQFDLDFIRVQQIP
jgi:proline iminopeptidase